MAGGLFLTLLATGKRADPRLLAAVYPMLLGLTLVVAIAMLLSTLTSSTLAAVLTVGVVIAGRSSDVVRNMREVAPAVPTWLVQFLYAVLPNFRNFDFKDGAAYGDPVPTALLGFVTCYAAAYVAVVLVLGLLRFRSRDFQ
jgi:ABC-type transport system involved in multi-copper enzyme maturation permease subunit